MANIVMVMSTLSPACTISDLNETQQILDLPLVQTFSPEKYQGTDQTDRSKWKVQYPMFRSNAVAYAPPPGPHL
eukprot:7780459-Ditylum_brightwellii.AAC.1